MQRVVSLTSTSDYLQTISLTCSIVSYRPLTYREMTSMMEDGFIFLTIVAHHKSSCLAKNLPLND